MAGERAGWDNWDMRKLDDFFTGKLVRVTWQRRPDGPVRVIEGLWDGKRLHRGPVDSDAVAVWSVSELDGEFLGIEVQERGDGGEVDSET